MRASPAGLLPRLLRRSTRPSSRESSWFWSVRRIRDEAEIGDDAIVASLKQALQQESFRDAVRSVADKFKLKRSRVYELGLTLERKGSNRP